jgi:small subunit ribosomal protein S16
MVRLRLRRMGAKNQPFYRIVAVDSRWKRDGKYIEALGYYDPKTEPYLLKLDEEKAIKWLKVGAQPSDTVRALLRKVGVLKKFHEMKYMKKMEESEQELNHTEEGVE